MSVPFSAFGITSSRRSSTRSIGLVGPGRDLEITVKTATVPFLSTVAGDTD